MALVLLRWAAAVSLAALLLLSSACEAAHHVSVPPSPSPSRSRSPPSSSSPPASSPPAAPAPGPAAALDQACLNSLLNMSDCLPYVQAGGGSAKPDKACCPELAGLVDSNPVCLCELLSGAADSYGIAVDYARALALPKVCRVATPPVSTCAALGYNVRLGPSAAPGVSPSAEGPQFPEQGLYGSNS